MSTDPIDPQAWGPWQLDAHTYAWIIWIAWFAVWETHAVVTAGYQGTLTAHLRPIFLAHPLLWFMACGAGVWFVLHFIFPGLEHRIVQWAVGHV